MKPGNTGATVRFNDDLGPVLTKDLSGVSGLPPLMCLAVPGKITSIDGAVATVDYGGITRQANISLVEAEVGIYVLIHAGYAIEVLDEEEAKKTLDLWSEVLEKMDG